VQFRVGNDGPAIAKKSQTQLFDAFFTTGKRGGTGLGLAIAKKIVGSHGGKIEVVSPCRGDSGVEFVFTLPLGTRDDSEIVFVPHSRGYVAAAPTVSPVVREGDAGEEQLEDAVKSALRSRGKVASLLIVDDEVFYQDAVEHIFRRGGRLDGMVAIRRAGSSQEVFEIIRECGDGEFDVVVCDIDLGPGSMNGYGIVKGLRDAGVQARIAIHSNRSLPEDYRASIDAGADAFWPKPLSRSHLLKMVGEAVGAIMPRSGSPRVKMDNASKSDLIELALVEDDVFLREAWNSALGRECKVWSFASPCDFWRSVDKGELRLDRLKGIITDYYFDGDDATGLTLAESLIDKVSCPVVLSSDGEFEDSVTGKFSGRVSKEPMTWAAVTKKLVRA
jgi:CheY-like chemotaxis protein